ncbi:hypothetical protein PsAD2_03231 [Pseudovibrio axinellae]|uniref:Uncharacterized protein n=1 Tax=Pseudovibrio axinellae TaxID=989403 RepID=A0A165WY39_9HYPH|nr:hypothetical protein PsAD2_03231 [Pseudovibrio axinellae]SEQ16731.1 hypothetical protein SAMN05421798_10236 [Pseudovibrio axinellae]
MGFGIFVFWECGKNPLMFVELLFSTCTLALNVS